VSLGAEARGRPLVLLDVDGVINLARFRSSRERSRLLREGGWFHRRPRDPFTDDRLLVNLRQARPLARLLAESGAELAWATTWGPEANDVFGPLLGLPALPVAPVNPGNSNKASTVIPWTAGRPWAWLEDQRRELDMARALTSRSVPSLPVLVDRATGLAGDHVERVREWLASLQD
jgi:hypothetical protein